MHPDAHPGHPAVVVPLQNGNRTPHRIRIGAKALVTDRNRVLLIRERREDGSAFWTLPGGGIEPDESVREGLCRELDEELQCPITVDRELTACTYEHSTERTVTLYHVFRCELHGTPIPNTAERVVEYDWVHPAEPPSSTLDSFGELLERYAPRVTDRG